MPKTAFHVAAGLALASAAQLQAAQTAQASCLTQPEVRGMVAYFLPSVLQSTIEKCGQRLGKDSYLLGRAPQLVSTLKAGRAAAWPQAKQAFLKIGGEKSPESTDLLAALPEDVVAPLVQATINQKLGAEIKPESCKDIDRIMAPLEPLPAANMIDVVTEVMLVAGRKDKTLAVCPEA